MSVLMPQEESHMLPPARVLTALDSEPIFLWHDDIRKPPAPGWIWARENEVAKHVLSTKVIEEISLDHDLGGHNLDPNHPEAWLYKGPSTEATGLDLIDWMIFTKHVPKRVWIHSMNGPGAISMKRTLEAKGYLNVRIAPYSPPATPAALTAARCAACLMFDCERVGGSGGACGWRP